MSSSSQTPEPSYRVAARFFVSGLPIALVDGAKLTVTALTVMQIGHAASSATPLAAATLGVLTFNVAGNMILTAPLSAMDTIAPQNFGAGNAVGVGLTALRAVITAPAFLLPTVPLWIFAREILTALGQPPDVAALAQTNMLMLLPSLAPWLVFEVSRKFVYAQDVQWPPLPAAVIGLATHPVWLEMTRGFGPSGPMLAPLFTFSVMAAVLVALIRWRVPRAAAAWPRAEGRAALFGDRKAWRHFLATSAASLFSLTEWLFWEAVCFRVGALGTIPLSAYSVGYSLEPCLFMLAIGLSTALTNAVGGHLGAGRVAAARRTTAIGVGVGIATVCGYSLFAFLAGGSLRRLFSRDAEVLAAAEEMWPSWSMFLLISGTFALLLGLAKGLGQQRQMAVFVVCVLWPVGCPLVWLATCPARVWQMLAFTYMLLSVAMGLCAACTDWHKLSATAIAHSQGSGGAASCAPAHTSTRCEGGLAAVDGAKASGATLVGLDLEDSRTPAPIPLPLPVAVAAV